MAKEDGQSAATITGTLVPAELSWHDDRGWTDQESANSDQLRRSWQVTAGQKYQRVQTIGDTTKIFTPAVEPNTVGIQSVVTKNPVSGFPGVFYYKV